MIFIKHKLRLCHGTMSHMNNEHTKENNNKDVSPITEYFREVIYGGIDGIVTTFAVVAGFSGAMLSTTDTTQFTFVVVLLFGLANLFADATSMGLGNFLSVRSEKDLYRITREKEERLINENPEEGSKITTALLEERGFSKEDASTLTNIYKNNHEYWIDFIMNNKLEMSDPRGTNPVFTGLATFLSFLVFGTIPLLPFIFMESEIANQAFYFSLTGTFIALIALGLLKWRVIGDRLVSALSEVIIVGGVAAGIAYYVGTFFAG